MSKELTPLEALDRLYGFNDLPSRNVVAYLTEQENLSTYHKIIRTALKVLEIIKNKGVNLNNLIIYLNEPLERIGRFENCYEWYKNDFKYGFPSTSQLLSKEEFDLLKEYFK